MTGSSAASTSSASSAAAAAAATSTASPSNGLGENKGIEFRIKTGGASYKCIIQDRHHYERKKAARTNTMDSVDSNASEKSL
ncbi:unnamed protein product [Clonostachys rosea f. rosea IK726]|uniref:Uncharacterized protein n=2 Tax=Bionectria ochroleuca TaxID=29856 RepID=A0ACA9T8Y6_BIOOC|nr:unnamed protein product [Clonostachys rosea f. rosea IK726]